MARDLLRDEVTRAVINGILARGPKASRNSGVAPAKERGLLQLPDLPGPLGTGTRTVARSQSRPRGTWLSRFLTRAEVFGSAIVRPTSYEPARTAPTKGKICLGTLFSTKPTCSLNRQLLQFGPTRGWEEPSGTSPPSWSEHWSEPSPTAPAARSMPSRAAPPKTVYANPPPQKSRPQTPPKALPMFGVGL